MSKKSQAKNSQAVAPPPERLILDGHPSGDEVIDQVRKESGKKCLLAFSLGKDAVAAWIALRAAGMQVVPFYMYLVPGLSFVDSAIEYFQEFFGTRIIQIPNPALYRMWSNMVFQPPDRCRHIEASSLPVFSREEATYGLKEWLGLKEGTYIATGVRCADSINRRRHFVKHGAINRKTKTFYPVWDLKIDGLIQMLATSGVKLPIDYQVFGRSFDGIDYRFLKPIKDHFPQDYQRILEFFPLAELEIKRYEFSKNKAAA